MKTLLLGSGTKPFKYIRTPLGDKEFVGLVTLDINPALNPDVVHDLRVMHPLAMPFDEAEFQEIHAYEVLEHLGAQGDWEFFFREWSEYYRILKPGGFFCGSVPAIGSPWVWGDPGHSRAIVAQTFIFLNQQAYKEQLGVTSMTDYRDVFKGDFHMISSEVIGEKLFFTLQCIKPSRI